MDNYDIDEFGSLGGYVGEDEYKLNEIDAPMPEIDRPAYYWLAVMPIAPRKETKGGIILPGQSRDAEDFMNMLGRIVAIGPGCFQSDKFRKDLKLTDEDFPKVGDIVRFTGVRSQRLKFDGATIIDIRDDQIKAIVDPKNVDKYQFKR